MPRLIPLNSRVVVKPQLVEQTSTGGILLPGETPKATRGVVLYISESLKQKIGVSNGEIVLFADSYNTKTEVVNGEEQLLIKSEDLIAVLEDS